MRYKNGAEFYQRKENDLQFEDVEIQTNHNLFIYEQGSIGTKTNKSFWILENNIEEH